MAPALVETPLADRTVVDKAAEEQYKKDSLQSGTSKEAFAQGRDSVRNS